MRRTLLVVVPLCLVLILAILANSKKQESDQDYTELRKRMVETQIKARGLKDPDILAAMMKVPRHLFVPDKYRAYAYSDGPLPIGRDQTISQPYIVAIMSYLAQISPGDVVLEIGTGSGYQAAVLAELTSKVYSIEIDCILAESARKALNASGYSAVITKCGDGYEGWLEHAPFDAILVTAAAPKIPQPLKDQLKVGGILVIPVGETGRTQILKTVTRTSSGYVEANIELVSFVPMTGKVREKNK